MAPSTLVGLREFASLMPIPVPMATFSRFHCVLWSMSEYRLLAATPTRHVGKLYGKRRGICSFVSLLKYAHGYLTLRSIPYQRCKPGLTWACGAPRVVYLLITVLRDRPRPHRLRLLLTPPLPLPRRSPSRRRSHVFALRLLVPHCHLVHGAASLCSLFPRNRTRNAWCAIPFSS